MSEQQIALYGRISDPMSAIQQMGAWFAKSGMFGVARIEQGAVLAMACLTEQKSPFEVIRKYHVIDGNLSMRADAMQAQFQANGGRIKWSKRTAEECRATFSHKDYCPEGIEISITMQELIDSGVAVSPKTGKLKTNYRRSPRQMLHARCISEGVRTVDPSVVSGSYTPEEIEDFSEKQNPIDVIHAQSPEAIPEPGTTDDAETDTDPAEIRKLLSDYQKKTGESMDEIRGRFLDGRKLREIPQGEYAGICRAIQAIMEKKKGGRDHE